MNEAQSVESKATQSVCAQCGSRLSATDGADEICINCLLRSAVAEDDDVDPGYTPRRSDQLTPGNNGAPVEFGDYALLEEIGQVVAVRASYFASGKKVLIASLH